MNIHFTKAPQQLSKMILRPEGKISTEVEQLIEKVRPSVEPIAKKNNAQVRYSQKTSPDGDVLLINSGAITSKVDLKTKKNINDVVEAIDSNIMINKQVAEGKLNLQDGLNILA